MVPPVAARAGRSVSGRGAGTVSRKGAGSRMEPGLARPPRAGAWRRQAEPFAPTKRPLVRPGPRAAMFFPLVVLVAVLPGLYALRCWDLTPPGPWWGLRGLAVLEGRLLDQVPAAVSLGPAADARMYRAVALQPPLYAWLEALALWLSGDRAPVATVLPSYAAGALVVLLVYGHGRLWRGPGTGLTAAVLTGFSRDLLVQMQQATPATLGLAGALAALLAYGRHQRADPGRRSAWAALGGLAIGLSLLAIAGYGLLAVPVVLLHQAALGENPAPAHRRPGPRRWWRRLDRDRPGLLAGAAALGLGLALAAPWYVVMARRYGTGLMEALVAPPQAPWPGPRSLAGRLLDLAPATLPLGLFAAARAFRRALVGDGDDPATAGGLLWVVWLAVAAVVPALLPSGPRPSLNLFLLVPLNLLAAQAMVDLAGRRIPARAVAWLAPATACTLAWWYSSDLRGAVAQLARGDRHLNAATALGLHLGFDLIVGLAIATRALDRWARRRDERRRLVLGGFLGAVLAVLIAAGIREVRFRHRETTALLALRAAILRRAEAQRFTVLAVVSPPPAGRVDDGVAPGGRLRFLLRATLPHLAQLDLARPEELLALPDGPRLVILSGTTDRLPYPLQARLSLEEFHPGRVGLLDAYATAPGDRPAAPGRRAGR